MIKKTKSPSRKITKKPAKKIDEAALMKDLIVEGMQEKKLRKLSVLISEI